MRAIDADALDDILADGEIKARKSRKYVLESAINTIRGNLAQMPIIEQPEIIRCRECKLRDTEYCNMAHGFMGMKDEDYCSYAERREVSE